MNWSSEWGKSLEDAAKFGTGWIKDGKHIPVEDVYINTILSFQHGNKTYSANVTIIGDLALEHDDDGWNIFHVAISNVLNFLVMKDACNNLAVISIWLKNIAQGNK